MKTPRDILLERHRSAELKLDAIREKAVATLVRPSESRKHAPDGPGFLREILASLRWHLAGMSAVWLVFALLNVDRFSSPPATLPKQNVPAPRRLLAALRENRRQLLELIESPVDALPPGPRSAVPQRRSELQFRIVTV